MSENIEPASPPPPAFTPEEEFTAYRQMLLIRRFEEKAGQMYGMGLIAGFCHLYIGQEAVVVGVKMAAREGDQIVTSYRDHGHMLACGMDPKGVLAELTGRRSGFSKGKGGSMHMFSREKNFFGGHGIVGAPAPIGAGLAFANAYRRDERVSLTFFGDGAANQGQVYETFNMAELWRSYSSSRTIITPWACRSSAPRRSGISPSAAPPSTFPARKSTAWTYERCAPPRRKRSTGAARGMGRTLSRRRPIAIAAIRCPIPRSIGPRKKSRGCARSTTLSSRCACGCWRWGQARMN